MTRAIQPDRPPGEFKCRTCNTMWSSYMKNSILCTDTTERNGLHDFDFAKPMIWIRFSFDYLSIWMNEVFENYKLSLQKRDQKPSKELVLLIRQSTKALVKFGELWKQVQDRGYAEGFDEKELQEMVRPYLKQRLTTGQIKTLFEKSGLLWSKERNTT